MLPNLDWVLCTNYIQFSMFNSVYTMDCGYVYLKYRTDRCDEIMAQLKPHEERWKQAVQKHHIITKVVYF